MNIEQNLIGCLPESVQTEVLKHNDITEIRLTKNAPLSLRIRNKQLITQIFVSKNDIEECVSKICQNSVHTHFESIKKGYIPFQDGYRIGVVGNAITTQDNIENITDITGLNIRIPTNNANFPCDLFEKISNKKGLLIFSAVNGGKTTLTKALIKRLALPPYSKRLSIIDTKKELYCNKLHSGLPVDFFTGYPKYKAIEMAIQNMSPDIIVCDEIGINDDSRFFIECKNCGIDLILTAHARNKNELMKRKLIYELIQNNVFECCVFINQQNNKRTYEILSVEELLI